MTTPTLSANPSEANSLASSRAGTPSPATGSALGERSHDQASDSGKLKTFLSILKKFVGVADIAAVRFSLPAQLLEPIPNLEYWHYLDRPDAFVSIGDSEDALGRMLQCLRFWFTKDIKYVKGKPCKPYNSTLGEFFRCQWEVEDTNHALLGTETKPDLVAGGGTTAGKPVKVSYLTEQTSHHPPVSAFYVDCPEKGISAAGYDQLSAKFTGTSIKVVPGIHNKGIFITLHRWDDEQYQLTHPAAFLSGILRGSLYVSVADTCFVSCKKSGMKVILHYVEEGWLGKVQNKVQGVIYRCDVEKDKTTRIKDVSDKDVIGRLDGAWHDKVWFSKGSTAFDKVPESDKIMLVDVNPLYPVQKIVPPPEQQLPNESRKFWSEVTQAIVDKEYGRATTAKQELEERQRQKAADRKARNAEWKPRFFTEAMAADGRPILSAEGRTAVDKLHQGEWTLEPSAETGA
ncbi:Oxysterol-binding protein-like protein 1 [Elsinoe australis]|uniref:Oxysterol-binding protein-like protein 1 n=1 Tax=Elsinoe australis TaxID=40998 RepID=A0A2P8A0C0_9PEZI|nr:Oxysterol-binding protein-like protein 1 [Elsinoe australis]